MIFGVRALGCKLSFNGDSTVHQKMAIKLFQAKHNPYKHQ